MQDLSPELVAVIKQVTEEAIAFNAYLGVQVESVQKGSCTLKLPWKKELRGDPFRPIVHGGVLAALADVACGVACFSLLDLANERISTVDMRIDYLEPGFEGDIYCDARVVRMGNRVAAIQAQLRTDKLIATSHAVYNVVRGKEERTFSG